MVQYTLAQSPDVVLTVPGKDSRKARDQAMDQLMTMLDEGQLPTALADGFSAEQLVEVQPLTTSATVQQQEDAVVEAIQVLNQLATLKVKVQASQDGARQVRELVDLLFVDTPITEDQLTQLKEGFKVLKTFAQANLRFKEARAQAETARQVLDEALGG
jgi:predicted HAD superfamily Cof-like phosphohydrolase